MEQINIWQEMYDDFKFLKKEITLFEAFAGIGSQIQALKNIGINIKEHYISEIDKYAIMSYEAIHGSTINYGSICDIEEIPQVDLFTYSFPCQDISLAGNQKGLSRDSKTRSGLLWEVERILKHQFSINKLPKILLMENVKNLVGEKHREDYNEWLRELTKLGYKNYWQVLNAKDYGIPQNRERVFCISVLGDYNYTFPKPFELKLETYDFIDDTILNFKLSNKMKKYIQKENASYSGNNGNVLINRTISSTITTREGNARADSSNYYCFELEKNYNIKFIKNIKIHNFYKYSPKICWGLMGFKDNQFFKAQRVCSNTQLYKQAGNSIVVNVLEHIFKELFNDN